MIYIFRRYVPPIFPIVVFILVFFCFQFSSKFWLVNILIDPLHIYKIMFQWLWDFPNSFVRGTWLWKLKTMIRRTTTFFFFFTLFIAILPQIKLIYVSLSNKGRHIVLVLIFFSASFASSTSSQRSLSRP